MWRAGGREGPQVSAFGLCLLAFLSVFAWQNRGPVYQICGCHSDRRYGQPNREMNQNYTRQSSSLIGIAK